MVRSCVRKRAGNVKSNNTCVPCETESVSSLRLPKGENVLRGQDAFPVATNLRALNCQSPLFYPASTVIYSKSPTFVSSGVLCKSLTLPQSSQASTNIHMYEFGPGWVTRPRENKTFIIGQTLKTKKKTRKYCMCNLRQLTNKNNLQPFFVFSMTGWAARMTSFQAPELQLPVWKNYKEFSKRSEIAGEQNCRLPVGSLI